jgi:hypothetical protein
LHLFAVSLQNGLYYGELVEMMKTNRDAGDLLGW